MSADKLFSQLFFLLISEILGYLQGDMDGTVVWYGKIRSKLAKDGDRCMPSTIISLNGHNTDYPLNSSLSTYRVVQHSDHIREVSLCSG